MASPLHLASPSWQYRIKAHALLHLPQLGDRLEMASEESSHSTTFCDAYSTVGDPLIGLRRAEGPHSRADRLPQTVGGLPNVTLPSFHVVSRLTSSGPSINRHWFAPLPGRRQTVSPTLTSAGFTAAVQSGPGEQRIIRSFDPTAEETLFYPRLVGG